VASKQAGKKKGGEETGSQTLFHNGLRDRWLSSTPKSGHRPDHCRPKPEKELLCMAVLWIELFARIMETRLQFYLDFMCFQCQETAGGEQLEERTWSGLIT